MTAAGQFIAELHQERRRGKVSSETELHLKHVFRKLGWDSIWLSAFQSIRGSVVANVARGRNLIPIIYVRIVPAYERHVRRTVSMLKI